MPASARHLLLVLLAACAGPDYALESLDDEALAADGFTATDDLGDGGAYEAWERPAEAWEHPRPLAASEAAAPAGDGPHPAEVGTGEAEAPAQGSGVDSDATVRVEVFAAAEGPTAVADYLFVLDESVSMIQILRQFRQGLRSLSRPGVFPRRARVAFMNMTPGDPEDLSQPHPAVRVTNNESLAPGFLHLVSEPRIRAFREASGARIQDRFPKEGCTSWFAPDATNAQGEPCLLAHAQISFARTRAEAGLVALEQWLSLAEEPVRAGAAVNVIFISDTHDPGLPPRKLARENPDDLALLEEQPDLAELESLLDLPVASFRLHAIAPESQCAEPFARQSYFEVAEASGGLIADVCTEVDYAGLVADIARTGATTDRSVLRLGHLPAGVAAVEIDGERVDHSVVDQAVLLDPLDLEDAREIRVAYTRR